jgi:HEAT repeat protein
MGRLASLSLSFCLGALLLSACGESGPPPATVDGKTMDAWKQDVESFDARIRADAFLALARFEAPPMDVIGKGLDDERIRARLAAMEALGEIGEPAGAHADALSVYLEKDAEGFEPEQARALRNAAMHTIGKLGTRGFKSVAHLLVSRDARLKARAAYTIKPLLTSLPDGVGTLLPLMEDDSWVVRREATIGMGLCGKGDRRASTALLERLDDEEPRVAQEAAIALGSIGGRSDHEGRALADRLYAHQTRLRAAAAYGLGLMGIEASPYAKNVADLVRNDNKQIVRLQAALAHWRISKETGVALPEFEAGLTCGDAGMQREALKAIAIVGEPAKETVGIVVPMLEDRDLRFEAASALGAMGPSAKDALPALESALEDAPEDAKALRAALEKAIADIRGAS